MNDGPIAIQVSFRFGGRGQRCSGKAIFMGQAGVQSRNPTDLRDRDTELNIADNRYING